MVTSMWRDVIELGNYTETTVNGEIVRTPTYTTVYAMKKGVGRKEFYDAHNVGLKPEIVFKIRSADFTNHDIVRYGGVIYSVIRSYESGEFTELVVSSSVGALNG